MDIKSLSRKFPKSRIRHKNGALGKSLAYIEWPEVVKRLNQVLEGQWSFEVIDWQIQQTVRVVHGRLSAEGIIKTQFGSCSLQGGLPFDDALKAASSDALKRCAVLFGVGLHLYGQDQAAAGGDHAPDPLLTDRQKRLILCLARQLNVNDAALDQLCQKRYSADLAALGRPQASQLIDRLRNELQDKSTGQVA